MTDDGSTAFPRRKLTLFGGSKARKLKRLVTTGEPRGRAESAAGRPFDAEGPPLASRHEVRAIDERSSRRFARRS